MLHPTKWEQPIIYVCFCDIIFINGFPDNNLEMLIFLKLATEIGVQSTFVIIKIATIE